MKMLGLRRTKFHHMVQRVSATVMAVAMVSAGVINSFAAEGLDIDISGGGITIKPPGSNVSIGGTDYMTGLVAFIDKYKNVALAILAVCVITSILCLIFAITKLGAAGVADNPRAKNVAMMGILISGIALALFGGLTIVIGFFWNLLLPGSGV